MQLSPNFRLEEFLLSQTATRQSIRNVPGSLEIAHLTMLCTYLLEPLRTAVGRPISVSSGFRSPALNEAVGGSSTSFHMQGRAADINIPGYAPRDVAKRIISLNLPFQEVIEEYGQWCHVAIAVVGQPVERRVTTATMVNGKTQFTKGIV